MKVDLAIIGQGAVTPAGIGVDALRHGQPSPVMLGGLSRPEQLWPVYRVDLKDPALTRWQREPRLRRSSPITLFLIEAAEQALAGVSAGNRAKTGLIVAFSAGCLVYSHRFFDGILNLGQKMASPALFPETVFNSPGSHVASALKLNGAAYALVDDEAAWVAALKTASIWLQKERVQQVLVLGAEEFDPLVLDAYQSARWMKRDAALRSVIPSEGAAGVLVRRAEAGDAAVITAARDGFIYRTKREVACAAEKLLRGIDPALPAYSTAQHTWLGPLETRTLLGRSLMPEIGPYLGGAFTASAAWNTLRALAALPEQNSSLIVPLWGLNHQLAMLVLGRKL
jgi:3-oxoacyl-(acyl-carrier-protein) synthase